MQIKQKQKKMHGFFTVDTSNSYIPSTPHISLLEFQSQVATGLTSAGKLPTQLMSKRGRPFASPADSKKAKTNAAVAIPQNDVRWDVCGHFLFLKTSSIGAGIAEKATPICIV